jgi:F0F1-type ATP synthase membrane subunit b/b'
VKALDTRNEAVKEMLTARLKSFEDVFDQNGTELSEKIARDSATLGSVITRNLGEFDNTVKTYGNELVERLGGRAKDVADTMRSYLDSFDQRVTGRADDLAENLDKRLVRFEDILANRVADMAKTLGEGGREIVGTLDRRMTEITGTMESHGEAFVQSLTAKIGEVDRVLGARGDALADTLDVRYGRLEELLVGRTEKVIDQVELRTRAAADLLNARMEQLSQSIEMNASNAERSLGQLAQSTTETIRASVGEAERALIGTSESVAHSFIGQADRISNEVGQRTHDLEAILSEKSGRLLTALGDKGIEFGNEIERATGQALQSIEQKGATFARSVADNSTEMARLINSAGENAAGTVNRTLGDLQKTADQAIARSKEVAQSTVSELLETHNMLRSDATALFGRLREANIMLQEVLSGSHENMSALENTLMLRVSEFVTAMNEVTSTTGDVTSRMESNIGGFREITGDVLANLGELARQFDVHGAQLSKAAALVERSNRESEQSIGERRAQLETLVGTLDQRTGEISDRLKRFSGLVEESLEAAAARARDIARIVSESSAEGMRAIDGNVERVRSEAQNVGETLSASFQRVREEAEDVARAVQETGSDSARALSEQYARLREQVESERSRASSSMHEIFEQNAGEAQALFEKANERFAETLRGMKQMAAEMQRELEETRTELRRGVFELPQETAESAAQMRRVIVDQIEALAELNRIVARHGRNLDAVEPPRRPESTPLAPRQEPRSEPVRSETPRPSLRNTELSSFAPAARRTTEPAPSPASGNQAGRGWLSDILDRASREDEPPARDFARERTRETPRSEPEAPRAEERSARHTIESLDSLSVDIARMIDHDAAIDLWDRYKRGERNVFTRRLYTLQGQQAFDDIRKKYRADRDFKQTVDRYIGEFERLLEEVSRDDRSQMVARTYLTSETGKVYTMLAHAAGRFE